MLVNADVLFFDGVCNLCNGLVNFCIDRNTKKNLKFSALQSEAARVLIPESVYSDLFKNGDPGSLVFWKSGQIFTHSAAAFEVLNHLDGPIRVFRIFRFLPRFLTDFVYRMVAGSRYTLFGKSESCRIPTPELKSRFLESKEDLNFVAR